MGNFVDRNENGGNRCAVGFPPLKRDTAQVYPTFEAYASPPRGEIGLPWGLWAVDFSWGAGFF